MTRTETAVAYEPYEAGITLDITPSISQGDLLRMEIELTRSDFRETEDAEKPPDQTASELRTMVFITCRSAVASSPPPQRIARTPIRKLAISCISAPSASLPSLVPEFLNCAAGNAVGETPALPPMARVLHI